MLLVTSMHKRKEVDIVMGDVKAYHNRVEGSTTKVKFNAVTASHVVKVNQDSRWQGCKIPSSQYLKRLSESQG